MSTPTFDGTSPIVSDRYIITAIAGEDLTMGQVVEITADWTVKKPTTNPSTKRMGICLTSATNGKSISIICRGLARATTYGAINAGEAIVSGPDGKIATLVEITADDVTTSAGTAAAINNQKANMGICFVGAASGGTAYILLT